MLRTEEEEEEEKVEVVTLQVRAESLGLKIRLLVEPINLCDRNTVKYLAFNVEDMTTTAEQQNQLVSVIKDYYCKTKNEEQENAEHALGHVSEAVVKILNGQGNAEKWKRVIKAWMELSAPESDVKVRSLELSCQKEDTLDIHTTDKGIGALENRHVLPPRLDPPRDNIIRSGQLPVFHGESGSGKTVLMLQLATEKGMRLAVYLLGEEVFPSDVSPEKPTRDKQVKEKLLERLSFLKGKDYKDKHVSVVIDEMGGFPNALRGLCRIWQELQISGSKAVKFFVGGTGCSSATVQLHTEDQQTGVRPGSIGTQFQVVLVDSTLVNIGKVFPAIKDKLEQGRSSLFLCARHLMENGRSGVLLCKKLQEELNTVGRLSAAAVKSACRTAAVEYRQMNGLSRREKAEIPFIIGRALWLAMFRIRDDLDRTESVSSGVISNWHDVYLVTKYGVVVDNQDSGNLQDEPRYTISQAQCQLFLMRYGLRETETPTGEGFEHQVKDYILCLLFAGWCGQVGGPDEILQRLDSAANTQSPASTTNGAGDTVESPHRHLPNPLKVEILYPRERVEPRGKPVEEFLKICRRHLLARKVVIVINGSEPSFADIIVFFPCGRWWLIQCKRNESSSSLSKQTTYYELAKMGFHCKESVAGWAAETALQSELTTEEKNQFASVVYGVKRSQLFEHLLANKIKHSMFQQAEQEVGDRKAFQDSIKSQLHFKFKPKFLFFCAGKNPQQFHLEELMANHGSEVSFKFNTLAPESSSASSRSTGLYCSEETDDPPKQFPGGSTKIRHNGMYPITPAVTDFSTPEQSLEIVRCNPTKENNTRQKRGREDNGEQQK